jgi:predicted nucleic acid-binding protein
MSHKHCFVDTNVIVYAHDFDAGNKHLRAQELIKEAWRKPYPPAISTQVLQELYVSMAKKGANAKDCREIVSLYYSWEVVDHDISLIDIGISYKERFKLSLWDGLIVAAAHKAKVDVLYTEDLQHGQKIENILIVNPFL